MISPDYWDLLSKHVSICKCYLVWNKQLKRLNLHNSFLGAWQQLMCLKWKIFKISERIAALDSKIYMNKFRILTRSFFIKTFRSLPFSQFFLKENEDHDIFHFLRKAFLVKYCKCSNFCHSSEYNNKLQTRQKKQVHVSS